MIKSKTFPCLISYYKFSLLYYGIIKVFHVKSPSSERTFLLNLISYGFTYEESSINIQTRVNWTNE